MTHTYETLIDKTNEELLQIVLELQERLEQNQTGRKQQVLDIITQSGPISISDIAKQLGISNKNVSSQLTYLRSDNIDICTNSNGLKFIA